MSSLISFTVFTPVSSRFSVITPDGRVVFRSLIYGGKAAEVAHILNDSKLVAHLKGIFCLQGKNNNNFSKNFFQHLVTCLQVGLRT